MLQRIGRGLRSAAAVPGLLVLLWSTNVVVAIPLAAAVGATLDRSFASSRVAERMASGFDSDWYAEFQAGAEGLTETFTPTISGKGAVLEVLEIWGSGELFLVAPEVVASGVVYAILWAFLMGGVLACLVSGERGRFAAAGGRFFGRFLLLGLISGGLYALVFLAVRWLFGRVESWALERAAEKPVFLAVVAVTLLGWAVLHAIRLVFDAARIAVVVDDQQNVLRALGAALGLLRRRPLATSSVYLGFGGLTLLLMSSYAGVAPTAGPASWVGVLLAFLLFQVFHLGRLGVRVGWLAAGVELYLDTTRGAR